MGGTRQESDGGYPEMQDLEGTHSKVPFKATLLMYMEILCVAPAHFVSSSKICLSMPRKRPSTGAGVYRDDRTMTRFAVRAHPQQLLFL